MSFTEGDSDIDAVIIDRDDVSNYNPDQILPESPGTIQKIRSWLQPTSYDIIGGEYRKHLTSHVAGTGAWLTLSATYREWLQSEKHGLLWIKGIPGSGKSVMAANLIHELAMANPGCPVLYFFFRQIIKANHKPAALLRDWMDQVLEYSPPLQKQLNIYIKAHRSIDSISIEDMWKDLKMGFAGLPGRVFCVADALDEMDQGHDTFLQALGALGEWRPGKAKVLITSRPVPSIEALLRRTPCLHLRLQESLVDLDISTYMQFRLSKSAIPKSDWQAIADAVPGRANGLFLYAKLAIDAFLEPGADISQVIAQLPTDLNILYTILLKDHAQRSGVAAEIQHLILQAVTHATRPLRLLELAEMVKTMSPDGSTQDLKAMKNLIRAACGPLLEILADETVSVIHHSFTEYLKGITRSNDESGYPILQMGSTHTQLALACLHYLQAGCLDAVKTTYEYDDFNSDWGWDNLSLLGNHGSVTQEVARLRLKHPFFEYAASNWHHHVNRADAVRYDQTQLNSEIGKFLGDPKSIKAWLHLKWADLNASTGRVDQLHIAARFGLASYVRELLKDAEVDARNDSGQTPLWWAATEGHSTVMRELIAAGANPNQDDSVNGIKPLHRAASRNHHEAVKVLLEAGVDPLTRKTRNEPERFCGNAPVSLGHTPLMYACQNGHLEALEAFLPFLDTDSAHRALYWSAGRGRSKLVARILQHPGVDVNAKYRGDTPLYLACGGSDAATITTLLQAGADPSLDCEDNDDEFGGMGSRCYYPGMGQGPPKFNCLHQLCGLGAGGMNRKPMDDDDVKSIFSLLLEAGVDVHQRTGAGQTALHGAVKSPVLTRLLLDAGAGATATDSSGSTPLHQVTSVDSMILLIEHGDADINLPNNSGETPLLALLKSHHPDVVLKFLEYGPDCDVINKAGNGAIHLAIRQRSASTAMVRALLNAGADPNLKNSCGLTPLHSLNNTSSDFTEALDMLLEAGADINAVNGSGATFLFNVVSKHTYGLPGGTHQDVKDLVERGASLSARDFRGRTVLHEAVRAHDASPVFSRGKEPNSTRFHYLVRMGLDIKVVDYKGNGLLHELALRSHNHNSYLGPQIVRFWEELVGMGLDLEQKDYDGRTPLHILCAADTHSEIFKTGHVLPIDWVISRTKNLDVPDNHGITPLHIAVTAGERYSKKLIDAGADPTAITYQKLTPLHLAARCRESNIVGLLLDALGRRQTTPVESTHSTNTRSPSEAKPSLKPVMGVNASATRFKPNDVTPLSYACRSGRPETVALLLEAGADVVTGDLFHECERFEEEQALWDLQDSEKTIGLAALRMDDTSRPIRDEHNHMQYWNLGANETTRLEEILELLVKYGLDASKLLYSGRADDNATRAAEDSNSYFAACMQAFADKHQAADGTEVSKNRYTPLYGRILHGEEETSIKTLKDSLLVHPTENSPETFCSFLAHREYRLAEEVARLGAHRLPKPDDRNQTSNLEVAIRHGFATLVEKIGTLAAESSIGKGDWHAFGDETQPGLWLANRNISDREKLGPVPFLLQAICRELPNMDVVRLLVEKFKVDVNEMHYTHEYQDGKYKIVPSDSPLFHVARGNHWWQVHQALPYLLKASADIHLRDRHNQTPLHIALQGDGHYSGPFSRDAVKILVQAGSDVNSIDGFGRSCLACAQHDVETIRLLKAHGATVSADSILGAIDAKNIDALRELLSGGVDPDMRRDELPEDTAGTKKNSGQMRWGASGGIEDREEFPLFHAAKTSKLTWKATPESSSEIEIGMQLVQVLLDHGADPFAKFLRKGHWTQDAYGVDSSDPAAYKPSIEVPKGFQECTTFHELLLDGRAVEGLLNMPGLDVNHRDAQGRTLFHVACEGFLGPDYVIGSHLQSADRSRVMMSEKLLSLGADLEARDGSGRNVLHFMLMDDHRDFDRLEKTFTHVLAKAPGLVNQTDGQGRTPLHYAIGRAMSKGNPEIAKRLLSVGADPLAVDKNGDGVLHFLGFKLDTKDLRAFFEDLVGRGVDVNGRNAKGETPLFPICIRDEKPKPPQFSLDFMEKDSNVEVNEEEEVLPMLQRLGANFFARDAQGRGLLHVAAVGDVDLFKELMDMGLDVMMEDNAQQTAIDVAAACGNQDIMELFKKKV